MTTVFDSLNFKPGAGLPPTQDGAQLQRSLLSQLERQWLDDWAIADQANTAAAAAAAKAVAPQPPPASEAGLAAAPGLTAGMPAAGAGRAARSGLMAGKQATVPAHATAESPAAMAGPQGGAALSAHAALRAQGNERGGDGVRAEARGVEAASTATALTQGRTGAAGLRSASPLGSVAGPARADAVSELPPTNQRSPMALSDSHRAAESTGKAVPITSNADAAATNSVQSAKSESLRAPVSALESASRPATAAGLLDMSKGMPMVSDTPALAGDEATDSGAPARTRRGNALPEQSMEAEPNPRLLRLREVSDAEVAASLRDANLDRPDSQRAAQGLARALMEAGYSRVQVVVNGVAERFEGSERSADAADTHAGPVVRRTATQFNTSSSEAPHGD